MDDQAETAEHYRDASKLAVRGGFHARYSNHSWFDWVDRRLHLPEGARVLDVGCGPGWFWNACNHLPGDMELTLLDASEHMVSEASDRLKHLNIGDAVVADAMSLPFPENSFDVVVAMHMLYHVADAAGALREMHRVLKPGGRCITTTNNPDSLPHIAELSHRAFGSAIDDLVQARYGTKVALDLMQAQFDHIQQDQYKDIYQVDDADPVIDILLSMPPGDKADPSAQDTLRQAARDLLASHDGLVAMPNIQDMISGTKVA